jgi:hypothetical protein
MENLFKIDVEINFRLKFMKINVEVDFYQTDLNV